MDNNVARKPQTLKFDTQAATINAKTAPPPKIMQHSTNNNSSSKNLAKNFNSKLEALTRSTAPLASQASLADSQASGVNSAGGFRVPSSRHFCGRLLSANLSQTTETNSSSTNSSYSTPHQRQNGSFEDDEDDEEEEEEEEDDSAEIVEHNAPSAGAALSTSSPSTASSSPKSHSPQQRSVSMEKSNGKTVQFRSSSSSSKNQASYMAGYDNLNNLINPQIVVNGYSQSSNGRASLISANANAMMKKSNTSQEIEGTNRYLQLIFNMISD